MYVVPFTVDADLTCCRLQEKPQKFLLSVQVVEKKSIDKLVGILKTGKYLSKQRVLNDSE